MPSTCRGFSINYALIFMKFGDDVCLGTRTLAILRVVPKMRVWLPTEIITERHRCRFVLLVKLRLRCTVICKEI